MENLRNNRWASLAVLTIGFLIILIDTTIVNVSIPTIIKDLGASLTDIEWVISGYALSFAALLIAFGRLGDLFGHKKLFIGGLVVFTLFSLLAGHASSPNTLIFARILQGIGAAMISPATLSIISTTFRGRERATAFGIWGATAGVAVAIGPVLGGYLTTYQTWRWIFYVNIPIGLIGIILGLLLVQETAPLKKQGIDFAGMATSALGFTALVFGLIEGQTYGWFKPTDQVFKLGSYAWSRTDVSIVAVSLWLSALLLLLFIYIELVKTQRNTGPAVNISFFSHATFRYGLIATAVISLGQFSALFTLPTFLQTVKGFTSLQSGYATLPLAVAAFIMAPLSARLVGRIGPKWVIFTGVALSAIGLFLLSFIIKVDATYSQIVFPYLLLGAGIGLAIAQTTQVTLAEIAPQDSGSASGVLNTVRQIGTALGIAIVGAVLAHQTAVNIVPAVNGVQNVPDTVKQQVIAQASKSSISYSAPEQQAAPVPAFIQSNPSLLEQYQAKLAQAKADIQHAVFTALSLSIGQSIRVGAYFVLLGVLFSLLIPNLRHNDGPEVAAEPGI